MMAIILFVDGGKKKKNWKENFKRKETENLFKKKKKNLKTIHFQKQSVVTFACLFACLLMLVLPIVNDDEDLRHLPQRLINVIIIIFVAICRCRSTEAAIAASQYNKCHPCRGSTLVSLVHWLALTCKANKLWWENMTGWTYFFSFSFFFFWFCFVICVCWFLNSYFTGWNICSCRKDMPTSNPVLLFMDARYFSRKY